METVPAGPSGGQIARHLKSAVAALPASVKRVRARADSGFYCWEAVEAYESLGCQFILVARKTARMVERLKAATWAPSPRTDADGQCEFWYQPEGWGKAYRFLALRYEKDPEAAIADHPIKKIQELLPWNFVKAAQEQARPAA